jgi:uncharacterized membrane protein YeaQ/YmgE (transglycosylase-associated protein family)
MSGPFLLRNMRLAVDDSCGEVFIFPWNAVLGDSVRKGRRVMDVFFWFGLVGWVAGWVTGKSMKCQSHSPWTDALMGLIGGLLAGYPLRPLVAPNNWGLLVAVLAATAGGVVMTWTVHRLLERFRHTAH